MAGTLVAMGRRKKNEGESNPAPTAKAGVIRVNGDIARWLSVIATATGKEIKDIVDPFLRAEVGKLYLEALKILGQDAPKPEK